MKSRRTNKIAGFTLVELMVVLVILGLVTVGTIGSITSQEKVYHSEEDILDMQMNAKIALQRISDIVRAAGFGCKDSFGIKLNNGNLPTKGDVAANPLTNLFTITNSTPPASDSLTLVAGVKYVGWVTATPAAKQITLDSIRTSLNGDLPEKSLVFVSPRESNVYQTISAISSNTLTLNENFSYSVGDNVYQVQAFTLRLVGNSLRIDENVDTSSTQLEVADNIQSIQFQYGIDTNDDYDIDAWSDNPADIDQIKAVRVFLLMRTGKIDREYTDRKSYTLAGVTVGPFNDNFHRQVYENTFYIRNLNYPSF